MQILSEEFASELRTRISYDFLHKIEAQLTTAKQNAKDRTADAMYFDGVQAAFKHAVILLNETLHNEEFRR